MKISIYKNRKIINYLYALISIISLIIIWHYVALGVAREYLIATPKATFIRLLEIISDKNFLIMIYGTLSRTIISFLMSFIFALILGFISGMSNLIYQIIKPVIIIIRSTPTMAIIIILLIWFGGEKAAVLIGFLIVFPMLYSNVVEGINNVDKKLIEMANFYKVKKTRIIKDVYLPSIRTYILAGINAAVGLNFKVMISAEVMGEVSMSIGKNLFINKVNLDMAGVFAWSILLIILVSFIDFIVSKLGNIKI